MSYVDGFLITMPTKNLPAYKKMAQLGSKIWKEYGALGYFECVIDDGKPKGILLPFPKLVKAKPSETVIFSWILYKSRAHRDKVNAKVMKDPRMNEGMDIKNMPFDMKRMSYGGFKVLVES